MKAVEFMMKLLSLLVNVVYATAQKPRKNCARTAQEVAYSRNLHRAVVR
jgi:hypothetical protein